MADNPFNSQPDPRKPGDDPPKPEQIWPPPEPKLPKRPAGDEGPVDLAWDDEVEKIDEAIDEIRKINGTEAIDDEISVSPIGLIDDELAATTPGGHSPVAHGSSSKSTCRVRPQSEAEIGQLWGSVFFSAEHSAPRAIVVTAARRGDGATQIATSLAIVGAEANRELSICLIDFNIRKPGVANVLGITANHGLTDVLSGTCGLEDAMHALILKNGNTLNVLTAGALAEQPLGMLKSRQVKALLSQLRERFDHTIIDTASANSYPDAQVLGSQVDGALLVVRASETPRETVAEAKKRLDIAGVRCLGLVLNLRSDPIPSLLYRMT
ncbi:MAG: CpsD/CapB family tyrosine-protein kinase [Planctomycetota bacterium]